MVRWFGRNKPEGAPRSPRARLWYWTRRTVGLLVGSLLLLVWLFLFAMLIGPTRGLILSAGVTVADSFLPGKLSVERADWPRPGHLVFRDILWVSERRGAGRDTLVDVALLDLGLDFAALRAREGHVDSLVLDVRNFDLPYLVEAFADSGQISPDTVAPDTLAPEPTGDLPYLNPGSIPGLPSATLVRIQARVTTMRLAPELTVTDLEVSAGADIARDVQPGVVVEGLSGKVRGVVRDTTGKRAWSAELRTLTARASADSASLGRLDFRGISAELEKLKIEAGPVELEGILVAEEINLELTGSVGDGRRASLVLGPLTVRGHEGSGDSTRAFDLELDHLGLGGSYDPDSVHPGDYSGMTATLDSLNLVAGPGSLGSNLTVNGMELDVRGDVVDGRRADVVIRNLGVEVAGSVVDSVGTRHYGLALEHLGMGARLMAEPDAPEGWRLSEVSLDSLNLDLGPSGSAEVAAGWTPDEPFILDTQGVLARAGEGYRANLNIDFALPGTSHVPALLPRSFPHEAFGALVGELHLEGDYQKDRVVGDLVLDIAETPWMEAGQFDLHLDANPVELEAGDLSTVIFHADSLALGLYGAGLWMDGGIDEGDIDLNLKLAVENPELVRMFSAFAGDQDSLTVDADLDISGTLEDPVVVGFVEGGADMVQYQVPHFRLDLGGDQRQVDARLVAGGGMKAQGATLDSLVVTLAGARDTTGLMSADYSLQAWEKAFYVGLGGFTSLDTVRTVRLDSLLIAREERSMALAESVTLTLGPEEGLFQLTPLLIEGDAGEISLQGHWAAEDFAVEGLVDLMLEEDVLQLLAPSPVWSAEGGLDLTLDADFELSGTSDSPYFSGHSRARLLPHRDHPSLGADLDFQLARGDTAGLFATLNIMSADTVLVAGSALWPGRADLASGIWEPDPTRDLEVDIPLQGVPLVWLNRLAPEDIGVEGGMEIGADLNLRLGPGAKADPGSGSATDESRINVALKSPGLDVSLPNRSRIDLNLDLVTTGTLSDPKVEGQIEIKSAFFRIPEIPRSLHAVEGPSLLWAMRDSIGARLDSTQVLADTFQVFATPEQGGPAMKPMGPAFLPDLDIKVLIPDNFRINGYGADIELEGDIDVGRGYDKDGFAGPSLGGEIGMPNGTIQFMNRVFKPTRGNIFFQGKTPPDPRLDILLEANVSGTIIRILITGQTSDPIIDLTSEPDMQQEDIMAVLLFGQPLNELDNDQRGGMDDGGDPAKELRDNLAGLAMAFGTQGLTNQMSTAIGVDMMQMGSDSSGGSTFMVGKFISPDMMVKYHASLEHSGTYFMTLEYTLSRYFKLVTTYGQGEEASGAEIQWSKKY